MSAGSSLVYSTNPRSWTDANGAGYVVKGPEPEVVIAEAVAYELAAVVGLPTPGYALAKKPNDPRIYFASHKLENCARNVVPWLDGASDAHARAVSELITFDIWIANEDRNLGGFLGVGSADSLSLRFIDFEKSIALRGPAPLIATGGQELYGLCKRMNVSPGAFVARISAISDDAIKACVGSVCARVPEFDWSDSVEICLTRRRAKLATLVKEVWL